MPAGGRWGPLGATGKHWVAAERLLGDAKGHRWALWGAEGAWERGAAAGEAAGGARGAGGGMECAEGR